MYAAALSLPGVPVPRPSSASLERYEMSLRIASESARSLAEMPGLASTERHTIADPITATAAEARVNIASSLMTNTDGVRERRLRRLMLRAAPCRGKRLPLDPLAPDAPVL